MTRALLLALLATACGGETPRAGESDPGPVVRDSTGIRIVESGAPTTAAWSIREEPLFTVGWGAGDPAFTWVQAGRIPPDGGALIGASTRGVIYRLGPDGTVLDAWGRKGEGPGEYEGFDAILLQGDSIIVTDARLLRLTLLSPDGDVLATHRLPGGFLQRASSVLPDGRLLMVPGEGAFGLLQTRPEWFFETQAILAADLESGTDTLAELPHLKRWLGTRGGSPGVLPVKGRAGGFTDGFAWARSDRPEVRWYDASGRLAQIARWNEAAVFPTAAWEREMLRVHEEALASIDDDPAFLAARVAELREGLDRHEGPLPYWKAFHVDRTGNAWMSEFRMAAEPPSRRWRVVARDGSLLGWVDMPGLVDLLDVTDDRVLGVRVDELDVPAVVMLALIKP